MNQKDVRFHAEQIAEAGRTMFQHVQVLLESLTVPERSETNEPAGRLANYRAAVDRATVRRLDSPAGHRGEHRAVIHDGPAKGRRRKRTQAVAAYALQRTKLWTAKEPNRAKVQLLEMLNPSIGRVHAYLLQHQQQGKKEIAKATGLATHTVENSLYQLRKAGLADAQEPATT